MIVYHRHGNGMSRCKRCDTLNQWSLNWDCWTYDVEGLDGVYCRECIFAIANERNETIDFREREEK